ncbi:MAG TPA: hypothetical protein VNK04_16680 [Gemmataceae bacterium]|nr:hypothetical protein [Gemmataceae bacterium]
MPPLTDPTILAQFKIVLGNWNYTGYVTAKEVVLDWIARELGGLTLKDIAKIMHDHLQGGGVIDQVAEQRPEWSAWPFHYDFRVRLGNRNIYIETILQDDDPKDPTIHIVSIHDV